MRIFARSDHPVHHISGKGDHGDNIQTSFVTELYAGNAYENNSV